MIRGLSGENCAFALRLLAVDRPENACITVVVPTFEEAENIPHLIERLDAVRDSSGLDLRLLLMDDDSRDGSEGLVRALALPWVSLVTRTTDRGLSARRPRGHVAFAMRTARGHGCRSQPSTRENPGIDRRCSQRRRHRRRVAFSPRGDRPRTIGAPSAGSTAGWRRCWHCRSPPSAIP